MSEDNPHPPGIAEAWMEAVCLCLILLTPLYFERFSQQVFEPFKVALLLAGAAALVAGWLLRLSEGGLPFSQRRSGPLGRALLVFLGVEVLATILSVDPWTAFRGTIVRGQGLLTLFAYVVVFVTIVRFLRERATRERLIDAAILASVPVCLYGLAQSVGLDPVPWGESFGARVTSTLGNPIFLGAYVSMMLFPTLARFVEVSRPRPSTVAYGCLVVLQCVTLVSSGSRGPFLGAAAGAVVFALCAFRGSGVAATSRRQLAFRLGAVLLAAGLVVPALQLSSREVGATVVKESLSRRDTAVERTHYWRGYLATYLSKTPVLLVPEESGSDPRPDRLRLVRPLIGHGADVAADVFMQRVPVEVFERYGPAGTADRAHNETWDRIVASGVVGLVAWVWLWSQILQYGLRAAGWRMRRRDRDRFTYASVGGAALVGIATLAWPGPFFFGVAFQTGFAAGVMLYLFIGVRHEGGRRSLMEWGLLAALLSHLVDGTVGFGVTATRLLFWVFAALLVVSATERHKTESEERPRRLPRIILAGLAAAIVAFVFLGKEPASPVPADGPRLFIDLCRDTIAFTETVARRATWLFVGCAAGAVLLTVSLVGRPRAAGFVRRRTRVVLVLLVPVLAAVVAVVSVRPFRADILARSGMQWRSGAAKQFTNAGVHPEPALRLGTAVLARASALAPRAPEYRFQFAEAAAAAASSSRVRTDVAGVARPAFGASCEVAASDPATLFAHAVDRLEGARRWNRTSPLIPLNLAHVHSRWSRWAEESEVRQEQARAAALRMQQAREMYPPGIDLERWVEDGRSP